MIEVKPVVSAWDRQRFFRFSRQLYRDNPYWVSWPVANLTKLLNPTRCQFYHHGVAAAWLAYCQGQIVGRIAGSIDMAHNDTYAAQTAFFGFYECIDDENVARTLVDTMATWAKRQGMTRVEGPYELTSAYGAGLLIEGFDDAPYVGMPYHMPYYQQQLEFLGFEKVKDLYAFKLTGFPLLPDAMVKYARRCEKSDKITCRELNPRNLRAESNLVCELYNDAFADRWGHVPIEKSEFYQMALDWIELIDPKLFLFVMVHGEPAGFGMMVPDAFQSQRNKSQFNFFRCQRLIGHGQSSITRCRFDTFAIRKKYRHLALGGLFFWKFFNLYLDGGFSSAEFSPIVEDNRTSQSMVTYAGAQRSKVYRIFGRLL